MSPPGDLVGRAARWAPAMGWMALIFVLSGLPGLKISEDASIDGPVRHLAHIAMYGVLGVLLAHALRATDRPPRLWLAVLLAALYGITDEVHQSFVSDRSGNPVDIVFDAAGALLGVATFWLRAARDGRESAGRRT